MGRFISRPIFLFISKKNLKLDPRRIILIRYKALKTANKKRFEPNFG